jgi:cytochrome P450
MSDDMALFIGSVAHLAREVRHREAATQEMAAFFRELIEERRAQPQDDLLSELVQLRDGDDRLSEDELVATCILLLFAGHETTTNHIANGCSR